MRPTISKRNNDEHSLQCEMAIKAAHDAFQNAHVSPNDIDMVIVACSNMERAYPAISIEIQQALGIHGFAFDLNVACSSATFAIQTGMNALIAKNAKGVLILNPEICSAHLNFRDRDCHFIFGDACTATILQRKKDAESTHSYSILSTKLLTSFSNNIRNNFGFLNNCNPSHSARDPADLLFKQQGRKVFKEVVPMVAELLVEHLASAGVEVTSLKRLWLHQANLSMNQLISQKVFGREPLLTESPSILHEYANTSSAGSVIAFHKFHDDMQSGDVGVLSSFGAGYSVGSIILKKN
jgi:beta-ketodecanoyl-[acyl-carrier-protein] synthase